ncbi:MAG TPA: preprotein translocase subunit SecG [Nitrolancea sp.]|jgi:preprotein translocase subunit SecG|nr:preprotein translocase subunit SecG [Nitrolancea sp.]
MNTAVSIAMILISVVLIVVVLMQSKGSGFSGAFGGSSSSIYRTRRGLEKTLYQFTIGIAIAFVIVAIFADIVL